MKITKKSRMSEILKKNPEAAEILFSAGMGEILEDGCKAHGMSDKEIDELVKKLNRK